MASRVYELSEYLVDVLGVEDLGAEYQGQVAYHESCSLLRHLGIDEQPKRLIASVTGVELVAQWGSMPAVDSRGVFH